MPLFFLGVGADGKSTISKRFKSAELDSFSGELHLFGVIIGAKKS